MTERILTLNAGSSTLKYSVHVFEEGEERELFAGTSPMSDGQEASFAAALVEARERLGGQPTLVGHRVVHGGSRFITPTLIDEAVLVQLDELSPLAPLHLPPALRLIRAALGALPDARHVACFDTAFHHTLPDVARRFALPRPLYDAGVRRYGFHGLSYEYVLQSFGPAPPPRLVVAHLGSGASMAAIRDGRSIDTSMGLTPAGGLPMGTRSGDLDPGVLVHLQRARGYSVDELERLIDRESGLRAAAGSADMAELVERAGHGDSEACFAIEQFAYAVRKQLGAYLAVLGGLDALVFTGGIGEHAPLVRELAVRGLGGLGIELDFAANQRGAAVISTASSPCEVRVVATNEDWMIARHAFAATRGPAR